MLGHRSPSRKRYSVDRLKFQFEFEFISTKYNRTKELLTKWEQAMNNKRLSVLTFQQSCVGRAMENEIFHGDGFNMQRQVEIQSGSTFLLRKISKCFLNGKNEPASSTVAEVNLHDYFLERMVQLTII